MESMHPHLEVRPLLDPTVEFTQRMGRMGFRPAATVTWHSTRQSKRSLAREFDKAKRRLEAYECSAEPVLIGSFPSYSASSTKTFPTVGAFPPGQEVREIQVVVEGTVALNAGTGTVQAADHNVMAVAISTKLRASFYGINDCYNLLPAEIRSLIAAFESRDPFRQDPNLRIGVALSTTAIKFKLKYKIPFVHRSLEVPESFSPTTDQLNLPGGKVDHDTNGAALTTVALASGASTIVISDVKLYVVANQIPLLHAGPPILWRSRQTAQSVDTDYGQACDLFVGTEEAATAAGAGARVGQFVVRRDGRPQPNNVDPVTLAQQFNESTFTADGLSALDITIGTIPFGGVATAAAPVPEGAVGTQAGAQLVPLEWIDGKIRAGAWQWPFWLSSRQIWQNLLSGQSAVITLLYAQVRPIYECAGQVLQLAAANGVAAKSLQDLVIRGGNDGETNPLFKGRLLRLKPVSGTKAS